MYIYYTCTYLSKFSSWMYVLYDWSQRRDFLHMQSCYLCIHAQYNVYIYTCIDGYMPRAHRPDSVMYVFMYNIHVYMHKDPMFSNRLEMKCIKCWYPCIHAYIHAYIRAWMHAYVHMCMHAYIHVQTHTFLN